MSTTREVPESTTACWDILGVFPEQQMCATERMVVKRKGSEHPIVLPCTLIAYDKAFEMGNTLKESFQRVYLNHPYCAQFCVLGGAVVRYNLNFILWNAQTLFIFLKALQIDK